MAYGMALITGATSGIGAGFARQLPIETGLFLTGRDHTRLDAVAASVGRPGRRVETLAADLATAAGRGELVARALHQPDLDLLICNAGLGAFGPFLHAPWQRLREVIDVNITGTVELVHALMPPMLDHARQAGRRCGLIVVSSLAGFGPGANISTYAASKAFGLYLAQGLAIELRAQPVDVLALCPSYTDTEFFVRSGEVAPLDAMTPDAVAQEGLAALGCRTVHLCPDGRMPQRLRLLLASNPVLPFWRWPRHIRAQWRQALAQS
jgi:uncharacterized protein